MNEKPGNTHRSEVAGVKGDFGTDPATEHREPARGDGTPANEVTSRREPATGPTTHDDTRVARKDGA